MQPTRRETLAAAAAGALVAPAPAAGGAVAPPILDLVFRGGGVKCAAYVGALDVLLGQDAAPRLRRLLGASAGAIFATCLAAGYSPAQLRRELIGDRTGTPFAKFAADPQPDPALAPKKTLPESAAGRAILGSKLVGELSRRDYAGFTATVLDYAPTHDLTRQLLGRMAGTGLLDEKHAVTLGGKIAGLLQFGAACDDRPVREWLARLLGNRAVHPELSPELTLEQFHTRVSGPRGQQLSLIASDLTAQEALVLNHRTAPRLPLLEAVRMSIGLPLIWPEVVWQSAWGEYGPPGKRTPRVRDGVGHRLVDGGLLANFPLRFVLEDRPHSGPDGVLGPPPPAPPGSLVRVLGLGCHTQLPADAPSRTPSDWYEGLPVYQAGLRMLDAMTDAPDMDTLRQLTDDHRSRLICEVGTRGFSSVEFDITADRLEALFTRGRDAMRAFLRR